MSAPPAFAVSFSGATLSSGAVPTTVSRRPATMATGVSVSVASSIAVTAAISIAVTATISTAVTATISTFGDRDIVGNDQAVFGELDGLAHPGTYD
jgi:hypothetical protein